MAREKLDALPHAVGSIFLFQVSGVQLLHVVVAPLYASEIDRLTTPTLLVLKNQHGAVVPEQINQFQPVLESRVGDGSVVPPRIVDEHVERPSSQKKLVRCMIDLLPSKVPHIEP